MALAVSRDEWAAMKLQGGTKRKPAFAIPTRPVWLAIPSGALKGRQDLPAGTRLFAKAIEDAEHVTLSLGGEPGRFEAYLEVTCSKAEDASVLVTQLEGVTTVLRDLIAREKKTPSLRDLSGVLVAGKFSREDRRVVGRWPVERVFLEALAGGSR
jgi:hypothetical protein